MCHWYLDGIELDAGAQGTPPSISDITSHTINQGASTPALAFTVGDAETPASALTVIGASSNATLVPQSGIVFGGSGAARTVTVTPAPGQSGTATITVTVTDGDGLTASDVFLLTVLSTADSDGDGLPDGWETQFGLNPSSATGNDGAGGDPDGDGETNLEEYQRGKHPRGFFKRYLAEGAINAFFDVRLALLNVGAVPARVLLRFLQPGGVTLPLFELLPNRRRRTLTRADLSGLVSPDFSTVVESDQPIVVDRTMSWDAGVRGWDDGGTDLHAAAAQPHERQRVGRVPGGGQPALQHHRRESGRHTRADRRRARDVHEPGRGHVVRGHQCAGDAPAVRTRAHEDPRSAGGCAASPPWTSVAA